MTTEEDQPSSSRSSSSSSSRSRSRRFLELPAARPYTDAISAPSLLRAIIAISQEIIDRSSAKEEDPSLRFPVQSCREGARRAVHVTRLVLAFLEELHAGSEETDRLLLPGLCELYVAFQKLRVLLQDCALRGARILLLMSALLVDREFQAFHESVATAVDSLLLTTNLAGDEEVAEMAELAGKQARRAARDAAAADLANDRAAHDVRAILARFERGMAPRRVTLRRLLDYLHVRTWADCHAEVTFLDAQISLAASDDTGSSSTSYLDLLHRIRGLMLYARAVLFDASESTSSPAGSDNSSLSPSPSSELGWLDPEGLRCPISLDIMTDPVTVSTGQTYNRASIVRWLRVGNRTCPVTGKDLTGASTDHLVPNLAIRNVIHRFCQAHHLKIAELPESKNKRAVPANRCTSKAAAAAMRLVATHLVRQLSEGSTEGRSGAVRESRLLAKSGTAARAALTDAGAAPWLLHVMASWDRRIQDDAAAAVMNLVKHPDGRREVFEAGGVVYLVDLLADDAGTSTSLDARTNAAGALFYLATADEEYRLAIGEAPRAVQGLVDLLKTGTYRGKKHAVTAILALLASPTNHGPVIESGAIPTMIALLATERDDVVADAMAAVAALAERPRGALAVLAEPSQVRCLVEVLRSSALAAAKECCISVLAALCKNGGAETVGYLNRIPTLMTSLYSLLTESSPGASKKSSSLIRILHSNHANAGDHLRFPASTASQLPASPPQLPPHGNHVHVR